MPVHGGSIPDIPIEDKRVAARAVAILTLVGVVNIPIIHYSVEWLHSLHQGASLTKFDKPEIDHALEMQLKDPNKIFPGQVLRIPPLQS